MKQLYLLFLTLCLCSCGNSQEQKISSELNTGELNTEIENKLSDSNQHYNCIIEYNRYENNILKESNKTSALAFTRFENGIATVTGFAGVDEGFGFVLVLSKDTCMIRSEVESTKEIFKLKKNDIPTFGLFVPSKYEKATLVNNPKREEGEIIKGKVDVKSEDYYEKIDNQFKLVRLEITAYFISEPMPIKKGKYKTLVKK